VNPRNMVLEKNTSTSQIGTGNLPDPITLKHTAYAVTGNVSQVWGGYD